MNLITSTQPLAQLCSRLSQSPYVTVDTEFLREKTFWPKLCLIQIASPEEEAMIDPLGTEIDLTPFFDLMRDSRVLKVFHAARQDIEIFHHDAGVIPAPMFDTQVAAMVCGFGDSVGYDTLARKISKVHIDKSSRFSDWSSRPLSERQLAYALQDVTHLRGVYEWLARQLKKNGREAWLAEEMAILSDPNTYISHPEEAWRRIKTRGGNRRFLGVLREIAAWREKEAQARNLPRNRIIREEALLEIAAHPPQTLEALGRLRHVTTGFAEGKLGKPLLDAISRGRDLPEDALPELPDRGGRPPGNGSVVELLKVLLKILCEDQGVASRLVAGSDDLAHIAADDHAPVAALQGWRRQIFGDAALDLKHGKLAIAIKKGKIVLTLVEP